MEHRTDEIVVTWRVGDADAAYAVSIGNKSIVCGIEGTAWHFLGLILGHTHHPGNPIEDVDLPLTVAVNDYRYEALFSLFDGELGLIPDDGDEHDNMGE